MRYYRIEIDDGALVFQSHDGTRNLPGALQIEMDVPANPFADPKGSAYVKVWGIGLDLISQSKNLNFKSIKVYGGFKKGLPLANPNQSGLLVQGYIFQAFGNWIGTEMSLDLIIGAGPAPKTTGNGSTAALRNLVINWKKGTPLGDAIKTTLGDAYQGLTVAVGNIKSSLIAPEDQVGYFSSIEDFATYVRQISRAVIASDDYQGVNLFLSGKNWTVYDSPPSSTVKDIEFKDLIGQPTWLAAQTIQFKCGMRADIQIGQDVRMPKTQVTNSQQAQTSLTNQKVSFQGAFQILGMRHVGNFRQPDASSWVTVFDAFAKQTAAA